MEGEKIFIVIPTYNERENIGRLLVRIFTEPIAEPHAIIVDDNSPDGTAAAVASLSKRYAVTLIKRPYKGGIGGAYLEGFAKSLELGATIIFQMDADLSHDPDDMPAFLSAIRNGYDVVIGSRKISGGKIIGWGFVRKIMSGGAMWFSRKILRLKTRDVTSGYRCFSRRALERLPLTTVRSNGYAFQEEILWLCEKGELRVAEIPITFVDRQEGKSKLSFREILSFFITIFRLK